MKIEIRETKNNNIIQVTTHDERFYYDKEKNIFAPSVNWIITYYPKSIAFYKWLANKGWDEAQAIKELAQDKGSKIHQAINKLEETGELKIDEIFINPNTGLAEEIKIEEYDAVMNFLDWYKEYSPELIALEQVVWYDKDGILYAGTLDRIYKIDNKIVLLDFKTGQDIYTENEMQISAYKKAIDMNIDEIAILQIGYKRNKKGWKYTIVEDRWELFLNTYQIWKFNNPENKIFQKDYPKILKIK